LWILKDNCHHLWKHIDPKSQPEPFFFDWIIGAIFHEAMKLKENVYLIERYRPVYQLATATLNLSSQQKRYRQFFEQILEDIRRGMERLKDLFMCAIEQAEALLMTERNNSLLIRFILENRSELEKLWQKNRGLDRMLGRLFPEGLDKAYCAAGENYLKGSWYVEAQTAFEKALRLNPDCQEAKLGLETLERRLKEWKERDGWGTRIRT
jgi:tetratricopeptide (TPR) repeat protein